MPFFSVALHEIILFLDYVPSLRNLVFKAVFHIPSSQNMTTDILRAINALEFTVVFLDGFRADHFEGLGRNPSLNPSP